MQIIEADTGSGKTALPAGVPYYEDSAETPADVGLPQHPEWREYQRESLDWILQAGEPGSVVALCLTKFLQESMYDREYSFDAHYGRGNYFCIHPDAKSGTRASECLHLDEGMHKCEHSGDCSYLLSKWAAIASPRASLNYAYWLSARWKDKHPPRWLFLDEAHNLSEIVTKWAGCKITEKERIDWKLSAFPEINLVKRAKSLFFVAEGPKVNPVAEALHWLSQSIAVMRDHYRSLRRSAREGNEKDRKLLRDCEGVGRKLRNNYDALQACASDWYIRSGADALQYRRSVLPGFVCKPVTAKHHFSNLFLDGYNTVAMSATIGDFGTFTEELGVGEYSSRVVPSRFPPERRPVYQLDVPKMGFKAGESDRQRRLRFDKQAQEIAGFIKLWPLDWCGLIHVTRIAEERELAQRLARFGLEDRVWCIPGRDEGYMPTNAQLQAWRDHKRKCPDAILVTCSFSEGYDGLEEKINISAKVPFARWGADGSYERAWAKYSRKRYDQVAAVRLAQQMGRNRRGRECDYDTSSEVRGANAVADGSLGRVKGKLPQVVRESLKGI